MHRGMRVRPGIQAAVIGGLAAALWGGVYLAFESAFAGRYGWLWYDEAVYLGLSHEAWLAVGAYRPPLVWSLLKIIGGGGFQVVNLLAVGVMAGALYVGGRRLGGWRVGLLCAAVPLTVPAFWKYTPRFMPEAIALAAVALGLSAIPVRRFWLAGAALGVGALGRPELAVLGALSLVALPTRHRAWALTALTMAVVILPFTIRNAVASRRFVPISANAGTNLWLGNLRERWLEPEVLERKYPQEVAALRAVPHEVDRDRLRLRFFVREVRRRPGRVWELWRYKAEHFWFGNSYWGHPTSIGVMMRVYVAFGCLGVVLGLTRRRLRLSAALAAGVVLFVWAVAIAVFPMERHRLLILPGIAVATGLCPVALREVIAAGRQETREV